jgi:hypothetical protein
MVNTSATFIEDFGKTSKSTFENKSRISGIDLAAGYWVCSTLNGLTKVLTVGLGGLLSPSDCLFKLLSASSCTTFCASMFLSFKSSSFCSSRPSSSLFDLGVCYSSSLILFSALSSISFILLV